MNTLSSVIAIANFTKTRLPLLTDAQIAAPISFANPKEINTYFLPFAIHRDKRRVVNVCSLSLSLEDKPICMHTCQKNVSRYVSLGEWENSIART